MKQHPEQSHSIVRCSPFQIHAAPLLSRSSNPIVTVTTVSTGACSTGRMTARSISTPPINEIASVRRNASQYVTPRSISSQQTNVENIAISPCAKLMTPVDR
jgi:hypothetical protein